MSSSVSAFDQQSELAHSAELATAELDACVASARRLFGLRGFILMPRLRESERASTSTSSRIRTRTPRCASKCCGTNIRQGSCVANPCCTPQSGDALTDSGSQRSFANPGRQPITRVKGQHGLRLIGGKISARLCHVIDAGLRLVDCKHGRSGGGVHVKRWRLARDIGTCSRPIEAPPAKRILMRSSCAYRLGKVRTLVVFTFHTSAL
jgi:hypothetical protein